MVRPISATDLVAVQQHLRKRARYRIKVLENCCIVAELRGGFATPVPVINNAQKTIRRYFLVETFLLLSTVLVLSLVIQPEFAIRHPRAQNTNHRSSSNALPKNGKIQE
jgi:hypothetical protein